MSWIIRKKIANIFHDADIERQDISDERRTQLLTQYGEAHNEFERRVDVSRHILTAEANQALKEAVRDFNVDYDPSKDPLWDWYYGFVKAARDTLQKLEDIAARDLQFVRETPLDRFWRSCKRAWPFGPKP